MSDLRSNVSLGGALTALGAAMLTLLPACGPKNNYIEIESYKDSGPAEHYSARFEQAYYCTDAAGNVGIVLRSVRPSQQNPTQQIEQILHAWIFWRPMPGKTNAEPTMTDALINYYILSGGTGLRYAGGAFVSLKRTTFGDRMVGRIESCQLARVQVLSQSLDLLGRAQVSGRFVAQLDRRLYVELLNRMKQTFGAPPRYQPRPTGP
jgi:hypothetical protein